MKLVTNTNYQYQFSLSTNYQYQLPIVMELVLLVVINTQQGVFGGHTDPPPSLVVNFVTKGLGFLPKFWEVLDPPLKI